MGRNIEWDTRSPDRDLLLLVQGIYNYSKMKENTKTNSSTRSCEVEGQKSQQDHMMKVKGSHDEVNIIDEKIKEKGLKRRKNQGKCE